jgi:WD40 repeat protein
MNVFGIRRGALAAAVVLGLLIITPGRKALADAPQVKTPFTYASSEDPKAPQPTALGFSSDSKLLAVGYADGRVRVYNIPDKKWLPWMQIKHTREVASITVSPDGSVVASCDGSPVVKVTSISTGKLALQTDPIEPGIGAVAFTPDGKELAGSGIGDVTFWAYPGLTPVRTMHVSDGEQYIAVTAGRLAVENDKTTVWDIKTGKLLFSHECTKTSGPPALSPDGKLVVSASGLWDIDRNKELGNIYVEQGCFGFAASGDYIVGGCNENGVSVYDGKTGQELGVSTCMTT